MNFVGLSSETDTATEQDTRWVEAIPPTELEPSNLHEAQLRRRLGRK